MNALWCLMCTSISEWLSRRTGLPIDFQMQKMTEANKEYKGERKAIGLFLQKMPTIAGNEEEVA